MKHIRIVSENAFKREGKTNCGECQTSCQSACKTSCTVGNQSCKQGRTAKEGKEDRV
ncbi:MAG: six-cysteine ranthipeptide SCIFF [Clostridiales bacterium]|nr:six-cysteine ranthipeptide SCIFF [Clostridiales bacterium]